MGRNGFFEANVTKLALESLLSPNMDLPESKSNRGYSKSAIVEGFITSIWCGANRFMHTEVTRHDAALGKIFDWKEAPAQDTYKVT